MQIKIALPKGELLNETASLLAEAGWGLGGYHEEARLYRLASSRFPQLLVKVFHEKDIPIQVAVGNYDLGICGSEWVDELLAKYPSSALVKLKDLGYGRASLLMAGGKSLGVSTLGEMRAKLETIRIATEYPNLAEAFALKNRLRSFKIFPVWGAAEAYPPESADLALISAQELDGLTPISRVLDSSACLIANRECWESKDLSELLASIYERLPYRQPSVANTSPEAKAPVYPPELTGNDTIWIAFPDGHQQPPTLALFKRAGIGIDEKALKQGSRRLPTSLPGVFIKAIRPQDMPLQVANSNFALAITGKDWLAEHRYQFPSSPVEELLDLKFGGVKIVAVISNNVSTDSILDFKRACTERQSPLRVVSEYVNIADKYTRDNHLGACRIIPTWGASEAFLPEDADLLIENTQTGRTIASHNLKIIDKLFESTACLIGNTTSLTGNRSEKVRAIVQRLRKAVEVK